MTPSMDDQAAMATRFHRAVIDGNVEVVERLLALGVDGNEPDWENNGKVALLEAASVTNVAMVEALLNGGCSPNARDCQGRTALHFAVKSRVPNSALVNALLKAGGDPTLSDSVSGMTPLHVLTQQATNTKTHIERAMFVHVLHAIVRNCDVNGTTHTGDTALHLATMGSSVALAKVLLDAKANPNAQNARGETPLMIAIVNQQINVAKTILDNGCDLSVRDRYHQTALHYAANNNSVAILSAMLLQQCDVNAVDLNGDTALHMAAGKGNGEIIKKLLSNLGCEVDLKNCDGKTAQHIIEEGSFSHMKILFPEEKIEENFLSVYNHCHSEGAIVNVS